MKHYRYLKPATPWRKAATFIYFIAGWNILACVVYATWKKKQTDIDPDFDKLSNVDKYLRMTRTDMQREDLNYIKIKGLRRINDTDETIADNIPEMQSYQPGQKW